MKRGLSRGTMSELAGASCNNDVAGGWGFRERLETPISAVILHTPPLNSERPAQS
jgi:hypothetical protein